MKRLCTVPGDCALITQHELLDTAIKKVGNRYLATMLVAKRIRQLHHGVPPRVQRDEGESDFSVTVQEIAEGLLVLDLALDTPDAESNGTVKEVLTPAEDTAQEQ
jgi:DNA-directed RNA polymerase omega subunit